MISPRYELDTQVEHNFRLFKRVNDLFEKEDEQKRKEEIQEQNKKNKNKKSKSV